MIMAGAEYGSVVRIHIQQVYLRYSSLLPVAATTTAAPMPAVEAATVAIGLRGRTETQPTASALTAAISV